MQTRRDQLHAYRFQNRRALAALVTGEPNVLEPPMRRLTVTTISGIMIAILIAVVFALVGLFKPATGDKWKDAATVIVEQPSGARYVLLDNVLHPVLNFTSAVLAAAGDSGNAKVVTVDRSDIASTKRGATIGIAGAPDSLPTTGDLVTRQWTVCSQLQQASSIDPVLAHVTLFAGSTDGARTVPSGAGIVVQDVGSKNSYLLYQGRRLLIADSGVATTLRLQQVPPVPVGTAFLEGVPQGPDLRAPDITGAGQAASYRVGGRQAVVGQLLHVTDNDQYFLVLRDGVQSLDPVQTAVLRTLRPPGAATPLAPLEVRQDVELSLPPSRTDGPALETTLAGLPNQLPSMTSSASDASGVCAVYAKGSGQPTLAVPPRVLNADTSPASVGQSSVAAQGQADDVVLPPGRAALVKSSSGAAFVYLLADPGLKFPLGGSSVQSTLGYGNVTPVTLAAQLVQMIPKGPQLDAALARTPVTP